MNCARIVFLFAGMLTPVFAQEESAGDRGFLLHEHIQGSANSLGLITKFDTAIGYQFNRYVAVEGGVPVYTVNPSTTLSQMNAMHAGAGIGNAYADVRLTLRNPVVNYTTVVSAAAPTGDKSRGFSTGRMAYDWDNLFDRSFGPVTPFVNLGVANTITDTPFFVRPFSSLGLVTHAEGGASYNLKRIFSAGASVYGIEPSGRQTVFSKLVPRNSQPGGGRHGHENVFEMENESVGNADITRDHGFSGWVTVRFSRYIALETGYSRSVRYALNSFFFGIDFNLTPVIRRQF